jgi:hypothetical protein
VAVASAVRLDDACPRASAVRLDDACSRVTPDKNEILLDPYKET